MCCDLAQLSSQHHAVASSSRKIRNEARARKKAESGRLKIIDATMVDTSIDDYNDIDPELAFAIDTMRGLFTGDFSFPSVSDRVMATLGSFDLIDTDTDADAAAASDKDKADKDVTMKMSDATIGT